MLVVDDEEIVLLAIKQSFMSLNYRVVTTNSPRKALEHLQNDTYAVIISDQRMAEMSGLEFLRQAKEIQPNASRILITGALTLNTVIDSVNKGEIFRFLAKPWINEELLATVDNAAQRYHLLQTNCKLQDDTHQLNQKLEEANHTLATQLKEITQQKRQLEEANDSLRRNIDQSLDLCYHIVSVFHPALAQQTRQVVRFAEALAKTEHFNKHEKHLLRVCARLQNLGLIALPRDIVNRYHGEPATLNKEQQRLVRNHPLYAETLAAYVDHLPEVGATIRACRERWNGTGIPDGLHGENIPKIARYLAVPIYYSESDLSREDTIEQIGQQAGKIFDPHAAELFLEIAHDNPLPRKFKEVERQELRPGQTLARGFHSHSGLLLIPEGRKLTPELIQTIEEHHRFEPITERFLIYV